VATVGSDAVEERDAAGAVPTARQGVAAVTVTSTLDAASTVVGLALAPVLAETNPFARALFATHGVLPTVVLVSIVVVATVVVATELGVWTVRECTESGRFMGRVVRVVGYGTPSVASLYAATNNVALVVEHAPIAI
jgi:hypothetical protein